jgi:hypothetical protein
MAPKTARALQHQVDWSEVGDHEVEVEVKRLFGNLRGDKDPSSPDVA